MPRVMYVAESFNAGVLAAVRVMAQEMHRRGWAVTIVHGRRAESPPDLPALFPPGTTLHELPWGQHLRLGRELAVVGRLRRLFRDEGPDAIHLVSSRAGAAGRLAAWPRFRDRVFYSPQGWSFLAEHRHPLSRGAFRLIEWIAARLGGTIVACSEGEASYGRRLSRRCVVVENAIAAADSAPPARPGQPPVIGTIGRITAQKDPGYFVEVVRRVVRERPAARFVWVGDGELRPILDEAARTGLPIAVTGWLAPAEVEGRLRGWSVFLLTSRYEGMPFAILEALALGVPVVARDVVGNRDALRDGVTGSLFGSAAEAAAAVLRYLDDEPLRRRTSRAAQAEAATRFAPERLGDEVERLYRTLIGR